MENTSKIRSRLNNVHSFPAPDERTPLLQPSGDSGLLSTEDERYNSYSTASLSESQDIFLESSVVFPKISVGMSNLLSQKYESLDYDLCENSLFVEEQNKSFKFLDQSNEGCLKCWKFTDHFTTLNIMRWFVICLIGILTACVACVITIAIEQLSELKFSFIKQRVDECESFADLISAYLYWMLFNGISVAFGSLLVVYVAPVAAGSGIPFIKCYLNGVKVPEVVRLKTLLVKAIGVVTSVLGGLAVGKEGPMIHCGAVIAAGISQGKSTTFNKDCKIFEKFREDHEKRDFVSAGAAAGVAAAFGAPVGGVLFSLEEGASFWNQALTWRIFFCSMISFFTLNLILSEYHHYPGQLSYPGLINFGKFENINYTIYELPVYIIMGIIGGLLGALYNHMNFLLTVFRIRYIKHPLMRVFEALIVSLFGVTVSLLMIFLHGNCQNLENDSIQYPIQLDCDEGQYKTFGAIWFQTPEATLRSLFHDIKGTWNILELTLYFITYLILGCWTYGLSVSSGLFIPTLLIGASWGRLFGLAVNFIGKYFGFSSICPSKFAIIGAAAMLGGVVRMTISLTVILMEAIGNITFGLPLMIAVMTAKWIGDLFNEGVYDIHIQLASIPILGWEPPPYSFTIYASEIMSYPVVCFKSIEKVGYIETILNTESHSGFPVVDITEDSCDNVHTFGRFRGVILRWQLIVLLQHKIFNETAEQNWENQKLSLKDFRDSYPRHPTIQQIHISPHERNFNIDLRPYMNPSAYTISYTASLPRIFKLFRALGLRHLPVIDDKNSVVGIVTRKDLARFRAKKHGKVGLEELQVSYS